jgi:hypothetical protein
MAPKQRGADRYAMASTSAKAQSLATSNNLYTGKIVHALLTGVPARAPDSVWERTCIRQRGGTQFPSHHAAE